MLSGFSFTYVQDWTRVLFTYNFIYGRVIWNFHITSYLQCVYWNRGHPDNENQSEGRTETKDSNIFIFSQSNALYKTMKSQLVRWPVMFTRLRCRLNVKLKPVELSCSYGFSNNFMLHSVYFRSLVDLENKSCVRVSLVIILVEVTLQLFLP